MIACAPDDSRARRDAGAVAHRGRRAARLPTSDLHRRMARPLYAQVNLAALRCQSRARAREARRGTQVLAVVKANAYGHGLMRVLPALEDADGLALVELDAAIELARAHYTRRILLLEGSSTRDELPEIAQRRLAVVVHDEAQVRMLETRACSRVRSRCSSRSTPG